MDDRLRLTADPNQKARPPHYTRHVSRMRATRAGLTCISFLDTLLPLLRYPFQCRACTDYERVPAS